MSKYVWDQEWLIEKFLTLFFGLKIPPRASSMIASNFVYFMFSIRSLTFRKGETLRVNCLERVKKKEHKK
jgi:hypothetical protein